MPNTKRTILVVDDDPDMLTIVRDHLLLDGFRVMTADSGAAALAACRSDTPDLVVLDLMLPDTDGLQVCRTVRATSAVPIIILTAKDGVSDRVLGLEVGADDYLVKPFDYLELAARIKARLRRPSVFNEERSRIVCGALVLNLARRVVSVDGCEIGLTPKECDVLRMLVMHCGQVVERRQMVAELWPEAGLYKHTRTIDVHIQHLREKIEADANQPRYILTVAGVGYRCAANVEG